MFGDEFKVRKSVRICGFTDPAVLDDVNGPYRSAVTNLRRVAFNGDKLTSKDRKFIGILPKGVAIVGGFARGMYLGSMKNVGDIDLAMPANGSAVKTSEYLTGFLDKIGYCPVVGAPHYYSPLLRAYSFVDISTYDDIPMERFVTYDPLEVCYAASCYNNSLIPIWRLLQWNTDAIKRKNFFGPKWKIDVLLAPSEYGLLDFLNLFDISVCQFAYLNGEIYATDIALADAVKKQFRFLRHPCDKRTQKYVKKGYKLV